MNIGIDHGYYAIKTRHFSFPAGIAAYSHEPYTLQNTLEYEGRYYVCGSGRQPILRDKTVNGNYFLLTLAAIAKEIKHRGEKTECSVVIGAGLPLTTYGREKKPFRNYLLRSSQPVCFKFEGEAYRVTIRDVILFPQGYSAIVNHPEFVRDEAREQVRRDTGLSVTDAQVERVLAGQSCSIGEEASVIIQQQGRIYTERLLSAAMESGFDLRALPVVMMGGGASVVARHIREQDGLCRVFALTDARANAEGYERIMGQMPGGEGSV